MGRIWISWLFSLTDYIFFLIKWLLGEWSLDQHSLGWDHPAVEGLIHRQMFNRNKEQQSEHRYCSLRSLHSFVLLSVWNLFNIVYMPVSSVFFIFSFDIPQQLVTVFKTEGCKGGGAYTWWDHLSLGPSDRPNGSTWNCRRCSDPQKLYFTLLLQQTAAAACFTS